MKFLLLSCLCSLAILCPVRADDSLTAQYYVGTVNNIPVGLRVINAGNYGYGELHSDVVGFLDRVDGKPMHYRLCGTRGWYDKDPNTGLEMKMIGYQGNEEVAEFHLAFGTDKDQKTSTLIGTARIKGSSDLPVQLKQVKKGYVAFSDME